MSDRETLPHTEIETENRPLPLDSFLPPSELPHAESQQRDPETYSRLGRTALVRFGKIGFKVGMLAASAGFAVHAAPGAIETAQGALHDVKAVVHIAQDKYELHDLKSKPQTRSVKHEVNQKTRELQQHEVEGLGSVVEMAKGTVHGLPWAMASAAAYGFAFPDKKPRRKKERRS